MKKAVSFCLICILLFLVLRIAPKVVAASVFYDFVANADKAVWQSGAGMLPFPGSSSDSRGFSIVVTNPTLEDDQAYPRVLETHPEWKDKVGYISGTYPEVTIPQGAKLELKVGFLKGATGTDGVNFRVYFGSTQPAMIHERFKKYTGTLDSVSLDLSNYQGQKGKFTLYVSVYATSAKDWACWVDAKVTVPGYPDIIVSDVWVDSNRYVHYRLKNTGDEPVSPLAAAVTNTLYVNGIAKATDALTGVINPGAEYESYFRNFSYPIPQTAETLRVCADTGNVIKESNEQNNCREKTEAPQLGGVQVQTGCPQVAVEILNEKRQVVKKGTSDANSNYSTGLSLNVGNYIVAVSKEGCTFDSKEKNVTVAASQTVTVVFTCYCAKGPDLVITDIKYDAAEGKIRYRVKNIGDSKTSDFHRNCLLINGGAVSEDGLSQYLSPGEEIERSFGYSYKPSSASDALKVCADCGNNVSESDETNNCLEVKNSLPDIVVNAVECDYSKKIITFAIKNNGEAKVDKTFEICLFINGEKKASAKSNIVLEGGATHSSYFAGFPESCNDIKVRVVVDCSNEVAETNEANNFLEKECKCGKFPDLIVSEVSVLGKRICWKIRNEGKVAVPLTGFHVSLSVDGVVVEETAISTDLPNGGEQSKCFTSELSSGRHAVRVCADSRQTIKESNEDNNCLEKAVLIEEKLPDFIIESIGCYGENYIYFAIKNAGFDIQAASWSANAEVYFDGEKKGTIDLRSPYGVTAGGIAKANGVSTYRTDWQIDIFTSVKIVADSGREIKESNESNNEKEQSIDPCVVKPPDLIIREIIIEGHFVYYKIKNIGEGRAGFRKVVEGSVVQKLTPCTALYVNGTKVDADRLHLPLEPGSEVQGYFKYELIVSPPFSVLRACADWENEIVESNEENNCLEIIVPAEEKLPEKPCGCFESAKFKARVTGYDGFAVGNVIAGVEPEIITAVDEDASGDNGKFYIYSASGYLLTSFEARFTKNDRVIVGDFWGGSEQEEIAVSVDDDRMIYLYDGNGALLHSFSVRFTKFDAVSAGDVQGDEKEEILIAVDEDDRVYVYSSQGIELFHFNIPWDFEGVCNLGDKSDHNDGMAVGNVFGDKYDEVLLLDRNGDSSLVYIYGALNQTLVLKTILKVRYTKYDVFTTGDLLGNDREEVIVAIDEDHMIYMYDAINGLLKCRYADITPADGIECGNLSGGAKDEIVIAQDDEHLMYLISEEQ